MKEKQRELGTESRLNACNESWDKGEISINSILLTTAVSLEVYNFSNERSIPSQHFFPLLVYSPENLSALKKLTKSNTLL